MVDLVIFDVPEGLPVPGLSTGTEIPTWNQLKLEPDEDGSMESAFIRSAFTFADEWVNNDGAVLVFYPNGKFITNEVTAWAKWANFKEEMKWVVFNDLPLCKPDFPGRYVKYFMAKLFVRMENEQEGMPNSCFSFNHQEELMTQGIDLPNDGTLRYSVTTDCVTVRQLTGVAWRGARKKSENLLLALLDLCTEEEDIILDLSASTDLETVLAILTFHSSCVPSLCMCFVSPLN